MDESGKDVSEAQADLVQPHATRQLLKRTWIGAGLAIDWIAMRGLPVPASEFNERHQMAASELIDRLADMPVEIAEKRVQGVPENENGPLKDIPAGIWRQTTAREDEFDDFPFYLIGTCAEPGDEWEGTISGRNASGYEKVNIRTDFVLEYWPGSASRTDDALPLKRAVSLSALEKLIQSIIATTPDDLKPLSVNEITTLVHLSIPYCPRSPIRTLITKIRGPLKPGPKKGRQPDRKDKFEEFCRNNSAA